MTHRVRVVRPDDLLNLEFECVNLELDASDPRHPALVPIAAASPAFLIVHFPPQSIVESAFFEPSPIPPPPDPPGTSRPVRPLPPPRQPVASGVEARLSGPSRLVFRLEPDPGMRIPYFLDALLDWSLLVQNVNPLADAGTDPNQPAAAPPITRPTSAQTAIELPYGLVLSPTSKAAWLHAREPVTHAGWTEVWHTRLAQRTNDAPEPGVVEPSLDRPMPLRAIWAQGFDPAKPPATAEMALEDPALGTTAMSDYDRRQIVILTSAFHGYVYARPGRDMVRYLPTPIDVERLMLTPLGGWLRSRGTWDPPRALLPPTDQPDLLEDWRQFFERAQEWQPGDLIPAEGDLPFVPAPEGALGDPLTLSEWTHVASQGRDHYVRIVYEGCLYPTTHPASLVKVTERRFRDIDGTPVAYLSQHMYVVVRKPEAVFASNTVPAGRAMPLKRVRLTTPVTPPIEHPKSGPGAIAGTDFSFWIVTRDPGTGAVGDFRLSGIATDVALNSIDFSAPLIFVPRGEQRLDLVQGAYRSSEGGRRRAFAVPGQQLTYAERSGSAADNTTMTTDALLLDTDAVDGIDCPFRPRLDAADVRIPAIEQLLGAGGRTTIGLSPDYIARDFNGGTGVFAEILGSCKVEFSANRAGGISTPNLDVRSLSRDFGPLSGDVKKAAAGEFDPALFFPPGTAKLFGTLDLSELILPGTIAERAPKLQTLGDAAGSRVTVFDWAPELAEHVTVGILRFERTPETTLAITGRIENPAGFAAGQAGPRSIMQGQLQNFRLLFGSVVLIKFLSFRFEAESGKKPRIDVALDASAGTPVTFKGDLDFIETLSHSIPPGLFGDGPSLDVDESRIRAGFGIGLPPLEVGIFALKNVTFSTALELPFTDGKPFLDFSFSERHHPFLLAVTLFGGGGFFHLQVDAGGVRLLEAALEFGVVAALDLGVASGSVHYMAGIYFSVAGDRATLAGYLRCGGEMRVLGLMSITVEFNLTLGYAEPKAFGRATLTVEVEIACFSKSVSLTVERRFGKGSGDPRFAESFDSPGVWRRYAEAFA